MTSLSELLQSLLQTETMMDFLSLKEDLENALYEANVVELVMFQNILAEESAQDSNWSGDLAALTQFLRLLEDGEEELEFPLFSQTRVLVAEREQANAGLRDFMQARLESSRASMSKLVKILDKILWVEKFVKMRNFHRWFLKAITDYVEINEYQEVERTPVEAAEGHLSQLTSIKTQCIKAGLRLLRRFQYKPVKQCFEYWRQLCNSQKLCIQVTGIFSIKPCQLPAITSKLRSLNFTCKRKLQQFFDSWKYSMQPPALPSIQPFAQPLRVSARIFKQKLASHLAQFREQTQRLAFMQEHSIMQQVHSVKQQVNSSAEETALTERLGDSEERDEEPKYIGWCLRMMRCMEFQKTRPAFLADDLYKIL